MMLGKVFIKVEYFTSHVYFYRVLFLGQLIIIHDTLLLHLLGCCWILGVQQYQTFLLSYIYITNLRPPVYSVDLFQD